MILNLLKKLGDAILPDVLTNLLYTEDHYNMNYMAFAYQLVIGALTCVLIYRVGIKMLEN